MTKQQKIIFWAFALSIIAFTLTFILQKNFEFIGYVVIVCILFGIIFTSMKRVAYPNFVLWLLLIWSILHMLGGVLMTNGRVIYTWIIYPIIGEPYNVLKYDQLIHAFGFFSATFAMYYVLKKYLTKPFGWTAVGIVVTMAGLGLGAFNEIIEFLMTVLLPNTNVGGYENTAIDLVSNFIGALIAIFVIKKIENKNQIY